MSDASFASDLAAHAAWTHALARELVRDGAEAEDVAQETLLRALAHPPRDPGALRGFLRRVLGNVRGERARGTDRRVARERIVARHELEPGADELAERLAWQRRLVEAVERLEEPFRGAIVLRFLEELPPRAIAARCGVPVKTVNSRLQRGLERLRADLDRREGGRRGWALGLCAWLRANPPRASLGRPAHWTYAGVALVTVVVASAWWLGPRARGAAAPASVATSISRTDPAIALREVAASTLSSVQRAPLGGAEESAARITGRVLSEEGAPLFGARVELVQAPFAGFDVRVEEFAGDETRLAEAQTAADGSFALVAPARASLCVRASASGRGPEQLDDVHAGDALELVLAPAGRFVIRAVCGEEPCAGAGIELLRQGIAAPVWNGTTGPDGRVVAEGLARGIYTVVCEPIDATRAFVLDVALAPGGEATAEFHVEDGRELSGVVRDARSGRPLSSEGAGVHVRGSRAAAVAADANGEFRLRGLPADSAEWTVEVSARGYAPRRERVAAASASALTLELDPELRLGGTLLDSAGRAVSGAWIACGMRGARSDEHGRFELTGLSAESTTVVLVHASGFATWIGLSQGSATETRRDLGRVALARGASLAGRVRTSSGRALSGAGVELQRLSPPESPAAAGATSTTISIANPNAAAGAPRADRELALELERAGGRRARSSSTGSFRFDDLAPGRYRILARANGYEATAPLELELPPGGLAQSLELVFEEGLSLSGLVRGFDGVPLANAWLVLRGPEHSPGGPVQLSGLDGRFTLRGVPAGTVELEVSFHQADEKGEYLYLRETLALVAPRSDLEIVLPRNRPIEGRVLDESGEPLRGHAIRATDEHGRTLTAVTDGQGRFRVGAAEGARVELELGLPNEGRSAGDAMPRYEARASSVEAGSTGIELHAAPKP